MAKILIVDDQKSVLLTLEALLIKDNHLVTSCMNSIDALDKLTNEHFDLMITDAIMPGGATGYALIRTVRSNPQLAQLPVILLTGKREKADIERGIESGANDYVVKPVDPELLSAKIQNLLAKSEKDTAHFVEAPVHAKAEWETKTEIMAVSELGMTIKSNIPMPLGMVTRISSSLYEDIGISKVPLRITACEETKTATETFFKIQVHFVGLTEKELTPLRLWIRSKKTF
ncbi:response regulator [Bdellovibrio bacteriovorus]|uniref:Two-component system sensor histidine kinase/response regulator, hybrid ('one-component system') n=1 Tax=Bdellovibrio bacteriovorus str. Tiberius TaxID=1069642 RepID=K7YT71_BDEBC|nr:response regulator [Bdellovibrio bacteriovorus]AFY03111.1 two-component system sensor histidine kinase/response regulator, hybrid ('one-component system') [Bdellovibrio bacteriovorus str. Tiberius]